MNGELGSVEFAPIQSCNLYTAYNIGDAGVDIDYVDDVRKALNIHFGTTYKVYSISEALWEDDVLRSFLVCGAYGTFPPVTIPNVDTQTWLNKNKKCAAFAANTGILDIREFVIDTFPEVCPPEDYDQELLYRVVNFLMCIRHDVQAAYMLKKKATWNPLVSFTSPFYYRKGEIRNWVLDNNILRAEIMEFCYTVYHFLFACGVIKGSDSYSFYLQGLTKEDADRLHIFDYIKDEKAMTTVCSVVSKMQKCVSIFDRMLRRLPLEENAERVTSDNLLEVLQGMYKKLSSLESYLSVL